MYIKNMYPLIDYLIEKRTSHIKDNMSLHIAGFIPSSKKYLI